MNISRPFIERPVATTLLMVALFLSGLLGYKALPVSALPEVDYPTIRVSTFYPGAGPEVMTTAVTAPLEKQFGQMPGLTGMSSVSSSGSSLITLRFSLDVAPDIAEQEVQAAMNAAGGFLPAELPAPPVYSKVNPADSPILTLAVSSDSLSLPAVADIVETRLAQKLSQVSGVGQVSVAGGLRPAVRIRVDPRKLASLGLSLENVRNAVVAANSNMAKGSIDGPERAMTIEANDRLRSAAEYRDVIVTYRSGSPVRIGDIAATKDDAENIHLAAWAGRAAEGSRPAIVINVRKQPGANVIAVVDRIGKILPTIRATLPSTVKVDVLSDRTVTIRASVEDVRFEMALAVVLVVAVIHAFLRSVPATIIPGVAVPLSLVGSFGVMWLVGFSVNNLTLMALTIATGFVVDDAIVMIENISRHLERGMSPREAALKGAGEIGFTIVSLTVSLIAVLIPLLFMGDVIGRLFREFAVTLAVAILISAVISLTLTPMMCARLLRGGARREAPSPFFERLTRLYAVALDAVLLRRRATLLVAAGTLALTAALGWIIPKGFFPEQDTGVLEGVTTAAPDISFAAMCERQQAVASALLADPDVAGVSSFIGVDGENATLNTGRLSVTLKPFSERRARAGEIAGRLVARTKHLPGVSLLLRPAQDITLDTSGGPASYRMTIQAPDSDELASRTPALLAAMKSAPGLRDVSTDFGSGGRQIMVEIDRTAAGRYGVSVADIDNVLANALGQRQVSTIFTQSNQYRVVLEVDPVAIPGPEALGSLYVPTSGGSQTRLANVARFVEKPALMAISRRGRFPSASIFFNLAPGVSLGEAVADIRRLRVEAGLPLSVETSFEGAAGAFEGALQNELLLILAAVVTMYVVLGVLYESYIHPVTILSTLPSAGVGALLALMFTGRDLNVIGVIGVILLIGIVKKNAIMMIDFALDAERGEGLPPEEAIRRACLMRFRPIMMTTMAALLGAFPLMLGTGAGSELRTPLGLTMVGGLVVSQALTLFTTPVIYLWFDSLGVRFGRGKREVAA